MKKQDKLMFYVQNFFTEYLTIHRGLSLNTIKTYRDSLKLFLRFVAKKKNKSVVKLTLVDLNADNVISFLRKIEDSGSCIVTRNLRLASLKTFFTYLISQDILHAGEYQKIIAIPLKKSQKPLMGYLEVHEIKAITESINRKDPRGERDYIILNLLYNTGARVSEICNLKVSQIRLQSPPLITVLGKGGKLRQIPLWQETALLLKNYLCQKELINDSKATVFLNSAGKSISRFGIRYIIQRRVADAVIKCPSLAKKKIGPHTIRHTTAMHLLQAGVDLSVIKSWLGHVSLSTTHSYVEIDLEMKRKALSACNSISEPFNLKKIIGKNEDVIKWLETL